jgi:hypothetical protein
LSVEQLQSGFMRLVKTLYSAEETGMRRRNFWHRLKTLSFPAASAGFPSSVKTATLGAGKIHSRARAVAPQP